MTSPQTPPIVGAPEAQPPPRRTRTFGAGEPFDDSPTFTHRESVNPARRLLARLGIGRRRGGASVIARHQGNHNDEESAPDASINSERPPIPSALHSSGEAYTTPLPVLSMIVLSITMLGEFLSANVSTPFVLFMVKGFGDSDEASVAFWTGILVATFFLTQFLTSLLWATVAEKHGQRLVLFISLFGSAITCLSFGTSISLRQAIAIRLLQGIFAGAVGVARGCVAFVTDASNEGRAYAILGFCWGLGGVAGAIIGGIFESPAVKWPTTFEKYPVFVKYPYLLPCALAAMITFIGSILSLFLGRDGGPREGAIRLLPEKEGNNHLTVPAEQSAPPSPVLEEPERLSFVASIRSKLSRPPSGYHVQRHDNAADATPPLPMSTSGSRPVLISERPRGFSRTSRANGSAYGYSGSFRNRLASGATARRWSMSSRRRRGSNVDPSSAPQEGDLNFAQRLLMANENAVTNIADLWVAAAMNVDNEDPFESDTELSEPDQSDLGEIMEEDTDLGGAQADRPSPRNESSRPSFTSFRPTMGLPPRPSGHGSQTALRRTRTPSPRNQRIESSNLPLRRFSTVSTAPMPSIFSHSGVRTPPAVIDAQQLLVRSDSGSPLPPIVESGEPMGQGFAGRPPSLASQIPILIIVQYGLLALHSTTHDQIFMSYLVSKFEAGGLNLNAGHFAQLIAMMCLAQIAYQFYLYPNMGPPRGRFSHLAMFRLGAALFIPAYLTVILYRAFASPTDDGNIILMTALTLSTALRYCGITFSYTSISILLNYMTPPSAVGYANGVAQSIVSLARCFGPVLGGYLWSISVQDDPSGYPLGFVVCAAACTVAVAASFIIR